MVRRVLVAVLCALGVLALAPAASTGAAAPPPDVEVDTDALVPVPLGCPVPDPADVAFVGTVLDKDGDIDKGTVRFHIDQIRAGSASTWSVNGLIDVRYGPDSKYLEIDEQYLVGAAFDPLLGALTSKLQPDAPLFGGDAVVDVDDTEVDCPELDDPVMTLMTDGTSVDTGLLSPLFEDRRLLLATIGVPAAIIGAVLVGLVLLRRLLDLGAKGVFALGRAAVTPEADQAAARVRHHRDPDVVRPADEADRRLVEAGGRFRRPSDRSSV